MFGERETLAGSGPLYPIIGFGKRIPNIAPIFNVTDPDSSLTPQWSDEYGKHPYTISEFYKGPLLAINRYGVTATHCRVSSTLTSTKGA